MRLWCCCGAVAGVCSLLKGFGAVPCLPTVGQRTNRHNLVRMLLHCDLIRAFSCRHPLDMIYHRPNRSWLPVVSVIDAKKVGLCPTVRNPAVLVPLRRFTAGFRLRNGRRNTVLRLWATISGCMFTYAFPSALRSRDVVQPRARPPSASHSAIFLFPRDLRNRLL